MSSVVPSRSSGGIFAMRSISSGDLPVRKSSVETGPGATALTVM